MILISVLLILLWIIFTGNFTTDTLIIGTLISILIIKMSIHPSLFKFLSTKPIMKSKE